MIILGVLLVVFAALLTTGVVASNTDEISAEAFGVSVANVSLGGFFLLGAATALLFALGLLLLGVGMARNRRKRVQSKRLVKTTKQQEAELREENERLAAQLERERQAKAAAPPITPQRGDMPHPVGPGTTTTVEPGRDDPRRGGPLSR